MHVIRLATLADLEGIAQLLQENAPSQGGSLTGEFPTEKVAAMLSAAICTVVAVREDKLVGVLFSTDAHRLADAPPVQAMLRAWPGSPGAYVYGPVCVAQTERGTGLPRKLYASLRQALSGREAILFIREDNAASLTAHLRLGMREVASFTLDGLAYSVLSDAPLA